MGCFDVVCALTNVPIRCGEKCHLYIMKKDIDWNYGVTWMASSEIEYGSSSCATVFHGEYNDYGTVENYGKLSKAQEKILEEFDEDRDRKHFFVCDMAWNWAQEKFKNWEPLLLKLTEGDAERDKEHIATARLMRAFVMGCKHPLSALGCYHQYGGDEGEGVREIMKLTEARLKEREEWYKKEFSEDEDNG